ncbi:nitrate/TMAO reductase, membrane-bound tetraheme cytochrome c subunit [Candidatus Scalindua japonica]|uniref:Nitrate/TMAO reductase, membrane-bound tetraheme cytochrome c subunit n=1 Tax=Candidatus Scalindua japonica TaxID=1284222 RepID=A0A286U197_9BACT|nr:NapC/NirT family cytochrome c [Candidatus Scalindua japonica]GAX61851.1 nitrate/TMAO reductase, membrane-bound tetraheme cytochrome c subunit [Candidatus Scalindua japonica]
MIKIIKNLSIMSIVFLIVFTSGLLRSEESALPAPDESLKTFLIGSRDAKRQQCSEEVAPALGRKCSFCHNVSVTEFTEKGDKAKFMMKAAVALGVKCIFCHAGKKRFTEKLEVAAKMFKLAEMMDVECSFCHAGKGNFTHAGKTAKTAMVLQRWAKKGNKKCLECHDKKKKFELNFHGWEILNAQKGLLGM